MKERAEVLRKMIPGWDMKTIEQIADVNPKLDKSAIPDKLMVSFVPMQAVGAGVRIPTIPAT